MDSEGELEGVESSSAAERAPAVLAHMTAVLGYAIPFGQFLGPYSVQLICGGESPFVRSHAREALNFQLTILGMLLVGLVLLPFGIGALIFVVVLVHSLVQTVRGAQAASRLEPFRYPLSVRLLQQ